MSEKKTMEVAIYLCEKHAVELNKIGASSSYFEWKNGAILCQENDCKELAETIQKIEFEAK